MREIENASLRNLKTLVKRKASQAWGKMYTHNGRRHVHTRPYRREAGGLYLQLELGVCYHQT